MVLSVIIVSYNVKYFLEQCLRSVVKAIKEIDGEIIVIDNASSDGSVEYLQSRFPGVRFVSNKINSGFGKANNQGLEHSSGELVLFLNPDTILSEDALEKCVTFLKGHTDAGALGVRMLDGSGKYLPESKRGFPSLLTSFFKLSGITARFSNSRRLAKYYMGHLPEKETNEVDVLAGAFLMVKKHVLEITGAFDEAFFMYGEDIDLSYRIQQAGWKNYYFPETTIIHFKGESTKKGDLDHVKMFYNAMSIFVKKHYSGRSTLFPLFIQTAIRLRAVAAAVNTFLPKKREVITATGTIQTMLVCTRDQYQQIILILEKIKVARKFHLATALPGPHELKDMQEIVFSDSVVPYKKMIEIMDELPGQPAFRFYNADAQAIIGSDSKNKSGMVIV